MTLSQILPDEGDALAQSGRRCVDAGLEAVELLRNLPGQLRVDARRAPFVIPQHLIQFGIYPIQQLQRCIVPFQSLTEQLPGLRG